jgi:putative ABC transport system permease protein
MRLGRSLLVFRANLGMAFGTLVDRPGRTLLTLLGITIGIVALVSMMGLVRGLDQRLSEAAVPLGVGVFQAQREPMNGGGNVDWSKIAKRKVFDLPTVRALSERLQLTRAVGGEAWSWGVAVRTEKRATNAVCGVVGALPSFPEANAMDLEKGRLLNEQDVESDRDVVVVGSDVVKVLFPSGPDEALGQTVRVKGRPFTVVGTFAERPSLFGAAWRNCVVYMPLGTFQRAFGKRSLHVTFIAKDPKTIRDAEEEAYLTMRTLRGLRPGEPDDFEMFDNEEATDDLTGLTLALSFAAAAICLIALAVGGVGVMNIMLVSVTERTREIGVRKALGARPFSILAQFVTEAVVLTLLGGAAGVALSYGTTWALGRALELPATVPGWAIGLALGSSTVVGLVAGIYPAARAARLDPIEALRYE